MALGTGALDLCQRCIKEFPRPKEKKVTINYHDGPGKFIKGTPLLKEVFCNLLGNSIKYSGPEVTIDIDIRDTIAKGRKYYEIDVSDNGHGIPDDLKSRIFRRFERGTVKAYGKGLGLYREDDDRALRWTGRDHRQGARRLYEMGTVRYQAPGGIVRLSACDSIYISVESTIKSYDRRK